MKRYGNLWPQVVDFVNLVEAARKAQLGKRYRENVLSFNFHLENELIRIQEELNARTYRPGQYKTFQIVEPKKRMISAAPYRDRVVHHALCNVIVPIFERSFTDHTYANRAGFGTHRALRKFIHHARTHKYILQCDISKYFPSIDHEILKKLIRRKIKCSDTLSLIYTIIDASNPQESASFYFPGDDLFSPGERRRGLPIGNLTSQFFANAYLNCFDHFVKQVLGCRAYVRYVDDFALFADVRDYLVAARKSIEEYLTGLRLKIHPVKSQIFETRTGANFLGFRILSDRVRIRNENLKRARRRFRELSKRYSCGDITFQDITHSIRSWISHLEHGDTWLLRKEMFGNFWLMRPAR